MVVGRLSPGALYGGQEVCHTGQGRCGSEEAEDNAARIVACVNGCEGINPEAVKDLLAACETLFAADHHDHFAARMSDSEMKAIDAMKAAIAKAKGES